MSQHKTNEVKQSGTFEDVHREIVDTEKVLNSGEESHSFGGQNEIPKPILGMDATSPETKDNRLRTNASDAMSSKNEGFESDEYPKRPTTISPKGPNAFPNYQTIASEYPKILASTSSDSSGDSPVESEDKRLVKPLRMTRQLGLVSSVSLIAGSMIGSGIFITPKGVLENSGSIGLCLVVWVIGGVISMMGALCYIELATIIPKSGGDYAYLGAGYGSIHPRLGQILSFLYAMVTVFLITPASGALVALTFSTYLIRPFFPTCGGDPGLPEKLIACTGILLHTSANYYSVRFATRVQLLFTCLKLLALVTIIIGGIFNIAEGDTQFLNSAFEGSVTNPGRIAKAIYNSMWSYGGWRAVNIVLEEVINPSVTLPLSIFIAIPMVTVLYLLTNLSYFTAMSSSELLSSDAVALTWGNNMLGSLSLCVPLFVAISTFGAAISDSFTSSRLINIVAREGLFPDVMSYVHVNRLTPSPAILLLSSLAIIMVFPSNIRSLIDWIAFFAWSIDALSMGALLILRFTRPDIPRPFKPFIFLPLLMLCISLFLVVAPIVEQPTVKHIYGLGLTLSGLFLYFPFILFGFRPPFMDKMTTILQRLLFVAPTQDPQRDNK